MWDVLGVLGAGVAEDEIVNDNLDLETADFPAVYAYASQAGRERKARGSSYLTRISRLTY